MNVGITGSRGFIGSHIADFLKSEKNIKLSFFDLPQNNLLKDDQNLKRFVKNNDVIIHTAVVNRGNNADVVEGGIIATYNLISAIKKYSNKTKLIFFSSIQAEMDTVYGLGKKLTEIILEDISKRFKIHVSIFRLTHVFGEGSKPFNTSAVATFCYQTANNKKITVYPESKNRKINLIYVEDLIKLVSKETFQKRKNPFYFKKISTGNEIMVKDLAKLIWSFRKIEEKKLKNRFQKNLYKTYLSYGK